MVHILGERRNKMREHGEWKDIPGAAGWDMQRKGPKEKPCGVKLRYGQEGNGHCVCRKERIPFAKAILEGTDHEVVAHEPNATDMFKRLQEHYGDGIRDYKRVALKQPGNWVATVDRIADGGWRIEAVWATPDDWIVDGGLDSLHEHLSYDEAFDKFCELVDATLTNRTWTVERMLAECKKARPELYWTSGGHGWTSDVVSQQQQAYPAITVAHSNNFCVAVKHNAAGWKEYTTPQEALDAFLKLVDEMKPKVVYGLKLLREDYTSIDQSRQGRVHYPLGKEIKVHGNGSYVAIKGNVFSGGMGPILVVVKCREPLDTQKLTHSAMNNGPPGGIECFRMVTALLPIIPNLKRVDPAAIRAFEEVDINLIGITNLSDEARAWILERL